MGRIVVGCTHVHIHVHTTSKLRYCMCAWLSSVSSLTLGMQAQQGLLYLVCVCLSVCLTHIFSDVVSLHVEMKVPTALTQQGADFYMNGFHYRHTVQYLVCVCLYICLTQDSYRRFIQKLWCYCLP